MVFDDDGGALGRMPVHRLLGGEHLARVTDAPVEVVGIGVHDDAVAPDVHVVADGDSFLRPKAGRRHPDVVSHLYHRACPLRHDASALVAAERVDVVVGGEDEVIPYPHMRLGMNVEVDMVEYPRPFPQVPPSHSQPEAHAVEADEEMATEEAGEVEEFAENLSL